MELREFGARLMSLCEGLALLTTLQDQGRELWTRLLTTVWSSEELEMWLEDLPPESIDFQFCINVFGVECANDLRILRLVRQNDPPIDEYVKLYRRYGGARGEDHDVTTRLSPIVDGQNNGQYSEIAAALAHFVIIQRIQAEQTDHSGAEFWQRQHL